MKPIKLTVNAFGSFLNETTIDFNVLNQAGFYLITGATGSGKTTIFDAIMYALYNEASGDVRDVDGFRNDLAEDDNPTYVEFTFENDGILYTVTRSPRYSVKTRKTPYEPKAKLVYGNTIVERTNQVNDAINNILGLSSVQFRQLIMLAQGEFMKLIHAKSQERDEIFRKIFGTEILEKIDNLLKEEVKELKLKQTTLEQNINKLILTIPLVEQYRTYAITNQDINNASLLIDELSELISLNKDSKRQLDETIKSKDKTLIDLITKKESTKAINQDFEKLNDLNKQLDSLKQDEEDVKYLKEKVRILKQLEPAKVLFDELNNLNQQITITNKSLELNKAELEQKQEELNVFIDQSNMIELDRASLENLRKTKLEIQQNIEILKQIELLEVSLQKHNNELSDVENLINITKSEKESLTTFISNANKEIERFSEYITKKSLLTNDIDNLNVKLIELDNLDSTYQLLIKDKANLTQLVNEYETLFDKYSTLTNEYNHIEHVYFKNIAGVLAKELKDNSPCPVCGSTVHPNIAKTPLELVSKDELDEKFNSLEGIRKQKDEKLVQVEKEKTMINTKVSQLLDALDISCESKISDTISERRQIHNELLKSLQQQLDECNEKINYKLELEKEISSSNIQLTSIEQKLNDLNDQKLQITSNLSTVRGNFDLLSSKLSFSNPIEELEVGLLEREEAITLLDEAITGFDEGLKIVQEEYKLIEGKLKQSNTHLNEIVSSFNTKNKQYIDLIDELDLDLHVLNNLEKYLNDLVNLSIYVEKVSIYDTKVNNIQKQINELNKILENKTFEDISSIDEEINNLSNELESLKQNLSNLTTTLIKQNDIYKELKDIYKEYTLVSKEYTDTLDLSLVANGQNQKRLSFERYVLVEYFDNILSHANIRLSKMTNGRYLLYRKVDLSKGRSQQGLDMEIFDFETGKKRDVKTLSGGETFKAALSLALGLADAIENKVGAISIDTLFIDEGFGTLDDDSLHQAIEILLELKSDNKSIGIISHVQELKDIISTKLIVTKDEEGSKIKIIA